MKVCIKCKVKKDQFYTISWSENEEDLYRLNHYTNFQPLWSFDNLSKGNRWCDIN